MEIPPQFRLLQLELKDLIMRVCDKVDLLSVAPEHLKKILDMRMYLNQVVYLLLQGRDIDVHFF